MRVTFSDGEKITKMMRVTFEERVIGKEYEIRAKVRHNLLNLSNSPWSPLAPRVASSPPVQGYLAHNKTPMP